MVSGLLTCVGPHSLQSVETLQIGMFAWAYNVNGLLFSDNIELAHSSLQDIPCNSSHRPIARVVRFGRLAGIGPLSL
jgi:hypothetical protein